MSERLNGQNERDASGGAGEEPSESTVVGIFSGGVANPAAGVFSKGIAGPTAAVALCFAVSFSAGVPAGGGGVSTLPSMIGKPSLPLPMTTTFEFVDCES